MKTKTLLATACLIAMGQTTATQAAQMTISDGTWSDNANWNTAAPSGSDDAVVDGHTMDSDGTTVAYTGSLTLNPGSVISATTSNGHLAWSSASSITMGAGSQIRDNSGANHSNPAITLLGDASYVTPFGASDHNSNTFAAITGGFQFTLNGFNNHTFNFDAANSFSALVADASDRYNIRFRAAGAGGLGDIDINIRPTSTQRSARLYLDVQDTIADSAVLTLNSPVGGGGYANDGINWVIVANGVNEVVAGVNLHGVDLAPGTYNGGDANNDWIGGSGSITILPVPEPSSLALLGLGGLMIARRRRG